MRFGRTGFLFVFIVPTFVVSYTRKKRHFESNRNDGMIVAILENRLSNFDCEAWLKVLQHRDFSLRQNTETGNKSRVKQALK